MKGILNLRLHYCCGSAIASVLFLLSPTAALTAVTGTDPSGVSANGLSGPSVAPYDLTAGAHPAVRQPIITPSSSTLGGLPPSPATTALTWRGLTLYGNVDLGFGYLSHGQALSSTFPSGRVYFINRAAGRPEWGLNPNARSFSVVGLRGTEKIAPDVSFIFDVQTGFLPTSGRLADGLKALVKNNGRTPAQMSANADSSRAGQPLGSYGFAGIKTRFGALTFGRQNALTLDALTAYDPVAGSPAFSVISAQATPSGAGTTEDSRLDDTFRYSGQAGPIRLNLLYQVPGASGKAAKAGGGGGASYQASLGTTLGHFSTDVVVSHIGDAILAGTLNAAQDAVFSGKSLAATVADTSSVLVGARYQTGKIALFGAYQYIEAQDPHRPVVAGASIWGYRLVVINNTNFVHHKQLNYFWLGARYTLSKKTSISAGYYFEHQNSFGARNCGDSSQPQCEGRLQALTLVADYRWSKAVGLYAGVMRTWATGGIRSGYQHGTLYDPTVGLRFTF